MSKLKAINFVSVEGFWEKPIHDARLREAAEKLLADPNAFAIATATYAPTPCVSFTNQPLGQYTASKLIKEYKISPMRILPAYLFDQKTTYTIIDAYSNAIMIGWVCAGLAYSKENKIAVLSPVTAGFLEQWERIFELNIRATKVLKTLSIEVTIKHPTNKMTFDQLLTACPEEANKLTKIKKPGEVLDTGIWDGNSGITRSFDNIQAMRQEIVNAFAKVFDSNINGSKIFELNDVERILSILLWNTKANTAAISSGDFNKISNHLNNYFENGVKSEEINVAKEKLISMGIIKA